MRINVPYSAARSKPVGQSQSRQSYSHCQHHQQFDSSGLLPQAGQILIPDTQQLLLAVRMSHKLTETLQSRKQGCKEWKERTRQQGQYKTFTASAKCDNTVACCLNYYMIHLFQEEWATEEKESL